MGQMPEEVTAVAVEEHMSGIHACGPAECGGLRFVDAGRPFVDQAVGDQGLQLLIQTLKAVGADGVVTQSPGGEFAYE
jgi:hypothetical protein